MSPIKLDPDEKIIAIGERTKFWLRILQALLLLVFVGTLWAVYLVGKNRAAVRQSMSEASLLLLIIAGAVLISFVIYFIIIIYLNNKIVITNERIVLLKHNHLFSRDFVQMDLGNVEEVSTKQRSLLANLFNYGTVHVETAGELANFTFHLANRPYELVETIDRVCEEYKEKISDND